MAVEISDSTPVESRDDIIAWMEQGIKTKDERRVGTEHEKFVIQKKNLAPAPYAPNGIEALLENYGALAGAEKVFGDDKLIGLTFNKAAVSLEPGGQFELSGAPFKSLHETNDETDKHLQTAKKAAEPLGLSFVGLGFQPLTLLADIPHMPKRRYDIMRGYMPKVGTCGLEMMHRSSTIQANLDFTSEQDMVSMFRVGMALQPVVSALFAASPFADGKPNGFKTVRPKMWSQTDDDRTGILPFVFDKDMSTARYVEWALDVPLYFVKRGETYHDVSGTPFRALLEGKIPQLPGERATLADWSNHIGTLFPEVRLKHFIEMRGADSGPASHIKALPALWVGLLYDDAAHAAAADLIKDWSLKDIQTMYAAVPAQAFDAKIAGRSVRDVARDVLAIAGQGLRARAIQNEQGESEAIYLDVLKNYVESGRTLADEMLEKYNSRWNKTISPLFDEYAM